MYTNKRNSGLCSNCQNCIDVDGNTSSDFSHCETESCTSKCTEWLEKCIINDSSDAYSERSGEVNSNFSDTTSTSDTSHETIDIISPNEQYISELQQISENAFNHFDNINMYKCKKIHMGNLVKVYGPIYINQVITNTIQQSATNYVFLNEVAKKPEYEILNIIKRERWCRRAPRELHQYQSKPAKYVIILDTQTKSAFTQEENIGLIQKLQTVQMNVKKWNDIAYNFLIGCDGNIYEGRGWGIIGSHTMTHNNRSIGISFIGTFETTLPTQLALNQAKALITFGVEIGVIEKDYALYAHTQIRNSGCPGLRLFEEIKSWDHWSEKIPD